MEELLKQQIEETNLKISQLMQTAIAQHAYGVGGKTNTGLNIS
jgi:hypothetical protein